MDISHPAFFVFSRTYNDRSFRLFGLKFEVFLVEMSTSELLQCYNKGCGKEYREDGNGEGNVCR